MDIKNYVKRNVLNFKSQVLDRAYASKEDLANIDAGKRKAIITIVDDDGTNRTNSSYTGIYDFLHAKGIPMTFAVPSYAPSSSSGVYSVAQLQQLVADGNEVVMHGQGSSDNANTCSLADFKTMVDGGITFANTNGFTSDIFVYPQGLQINLGTEVEAKLAYLKEKGIKAAFNVNTAVESSSYEGYESWYSYANGHDYNGIANIIPFATMPNGYGKELLLNRANLGRATLSKNWWHDLIHGFIENKAYIVLFMHSFQTEWSTVGEDGKTTTDLFKELIEELISTYGDDIEWRTASQAVAEINNIPITKAGVEQMLDMMTREEIMNRLNGGDN